MPTRQRRPSKLKQFFITLILVAFLAYMGFSAISGKYGTNNRKLIIDDIKQLEVKTALLQTEIEEYKKKIALFDPQKLDPDILSERALELLLMVQENDRIIILDEEQINQ